MKLCILDQVADDMYIKVLLVFRLVICMKKIELYQIERQRMLLHGTWMSHEDRLYAQCTSVLNMQLLFKISWTFYT